MRPVRRTDIGLVGTLAALVAGCSFFLDPLDTSSTSADTGGSGGAGVAGTSGTGGAAGPGGTAGSAGAAACAGNQKPTARFDWSHSDRTVNLDPSGSSDPDGTIGQYDWVLAEGTPIKRDSAQLETYRFPTAGEYEVVLTVTDNCGTTGEHRAVVYATNPPNVVPWALDEFGPPDSQSSWGEAEMGGTWDRTGTAADYSVSDGTGRMIIPAPGVTREASLNDAWGRHRHTELRTIVTLDHTPTGAGTYVSLVGRDAGTSRYYVKAVFTDYNGVTLGLEGGSFAPFVGTAHALLDGLEHNQGDRVHVALQLVGDSEDGDVATYLASKAWKDGDAEPDAWQVTACDATVALQAGGSVGLVGYLSGTAEDDPVGVSFDRFSAASPTPNAGPPPKAKFSVEANESLTVGLDASASEPGGSELSYEWDFGDGSETRLGKTRQHTYGKAGIYRVTLTVTDRAGTKACAVDEEVTVGAPL